MQEWLGGLKPGDPVIVEYGFRDRAVGSVTRRTPSGMIEATYAGCKPQMFNKDGRLRGSDSYSRSRLIRPTPELLREVKRVELANKLRHFNSWGELPLESLQTISDELKRAMKTLPAARTGLSG